MKGSGKAWKDSGHASLSSVILSDPTSLLYSQPAKHRCILIHRSTYKTVCRLLSPLPRECAGLTQWRCPSVCLFVCRLWNLLSHSPGVSTWRRARLIRIDSHTLVVVKLHAIRPNVGGYKQKTCLSRRHSVLLNRLRIGHTRLTHSLVMTYLVSAH